MNNLETAIVGYMLINVSVVMVSAFQVIILRKIKTGSFNSKEKKSTEPFIKQLFLELATSFFNAIVILFFGLGIIAFLGAEGSLKNE